MMEEIQHLIKGDWAYNHALRQHCQIIEIKKIWSELFYKVWIPEEDRILQVSSSQLVPIEKAAESSNEAITYIISAARIAEALTEDVLLAPIESSLIPLPHQIKALSRAISNDQVRYLLADEVGLGKTIEAGLIMRELKLRGLAKRILVIAPRGLVIQWVSEMRFHFGESFQLILPEDLSSIKRLYPLSNSQTRNPIISNIRERTHVQDAFPSNLWQMFSQIVVPLDSVKPIEKRQGWTKNQVDEYNRERFEDLASAGWDLVIIDEAHKLGGSTEQVARFKLGQALSDVVPYLLMLSATPHQGKTDAFHRLISLIDSKVFPNAESISKERIKPYVIRTEKRRAIDAYGNPLFKPRKTELVPVAWEQKHKNQQLLYNAVTAYVREGYNQAVKEKQNYIGFLMILMQRLVVSSTHAIKTSLERRLEVLHTPDEQLSLFPKYLEEDWNELDSQEQYETLMTMRFKALKNERNEVKLLLGAASQCEQINPDAKAEALLSWIYRLQAEESNSELKILVFTEFVASQEMLHDFLNQRGFHVVCLNGSMDIDERKRAEETFAHEARILISTDAGGEGLNLQFCHVVINYDIPWNPMRLEQRIGRVDRIGQRHTVRAINFVFENSIEHRVQEVLKEKLAIIFDEFGIDKTGDILDSAQASRIFDNLYVDAILKPEKIESAVDNSISLLKEQTENAIENASLLGEVEDLDPAEAKKLMAHPMPHWIERMTLNFLKVQGGIVEKRDRSWDLTWPDGDKYSNVVFSLKEAEENPGCRYITLEDLKIQNIIKKIPHFFPGQPIPVIWLHRISEQIKGLWSLWHITLGNEASKIMPLFLSDNGSILLPTSRNIWDQLLSMEPTIHTFLRGDSARNAFEQSSSAAEENGYSIYEILKNDQEDLIARKHEKASYAFSARRNSIEKIGLPEVRNFRLKLLEQEEKSFYSQLENRSTIYPDLIPLIILRVEGGRQ